ncbi:RNA polymerase sigma factor [Saccharopolyspora sp. NPDC050642]|uniref:RNA polymerase sigma factor n=1 Tax=Saccharopolyspora sp. NPDC050642 TaxID=3157099 RepID=UPI0033F65212
MTVGASADEALVAAAQRGDAAAFDALVRRHTAKMYRVAYRILGDSAEAEDAVQEAWVSAWRSLDRFRGESAPTTWLFRVVTNAALATLRRRKLTVPLGPTADLISDRIAVDPEGYVVRTEDAARVHRAIATLEPSQRIPLVLRELEGLSYEEIAEMLDVPVAALRSRLHRARAVLLARLKEMRDG